MEPSAPKQSAESKSTTCKCGFTADDMVQIARDYLQSGTVYTETPVQVDWKRELDACRQWNTVNTSANGDNGIQCALPFDLDISIERLVHHTFAVRLERDGQVHYAVLHPPNGF
ncbi:MAG: hypothetical protein ACYCOU_22495 [Sulfobacillus sp.]